MEKILIAEDDLLLQKFLGSRLERYKDKFDTIFADDGDQAIELLNQRHISLLVTDIIMPKTDGFALLSYINNKFPHIPCIVMTARAITKFQQKFSRDNIFRIFQKPFELEEMIEAILQALEPDVPDGTLKGISVPSFLQMIQLEEKTCLLEIETPSRSRGLFFFKQGFPFDAVCDGMKGEEAAYKIIGMEKAEIRFKQLPREKITRRINAGLTSLIMEAMRRKDESDG